MLFRLVSFAAGLALSTAALVQLEPEVTPHNPELSSWSKVEPTHSEKKIHLHVGLKVESENLANLEKIFWDVSDPDHASYGQHLSIEEVRDVLAVPSTRIEKVRAWLQGAGAERITLNPHKDMFEVDISAQHLERMLHTKLHEFSHKEHKNVVITRASAQYWVPSDISSHVNIVGELLQFPNPRSSKLRNLKGSGTWPNECDSGSCAGLVQPSVLNKRYSLPTSLASDTASGNAMAVAEFQGQYFKPTDLQKFSTICKQNVSVAKIVGGNSNSAGIEAELDIEYIKSIAPSIPLTVVYSSAYSLLNWVNSITSDASSPRVHSVSYGNDEAQQTSRAFIAQASTAFQKAGAQGISILFASGDQGVCGREGCGFLKKKFHPDFPAGSPYITSVGGTNFAGAGIGDETAWSGSGGGFSDNFGIPDFQKDAVAGYKASPDAKLPSSSYYNNTGRGYPDIAALGGTKTPYCIASNGFFEGVAGTSAACPVAAGVFARLNGIRLSSGKSVMGFLNPWIYKNPSVFNDVTSGCNNEGGSAGFTAVKGWDPATGLGTPNFEAMAKAL